MFSWEKLHDKKKGPVRKDSIIVSSGVWENQEST